MKPVGTRKRQGAFPLVCIAAALFTPCISAQGQEPMPLYRLSEPIVFDGAVNEPAWEAVPSLPLTVYQPTYGGEATERTEIRVAYDDDYLYIAGRLYDSNSDGGNVKTLYRDRYSGDDVFGIVLDSYNDRETAVWFTVNPAGVRADRSISNDGESNNDMPMNSNWNTFWDAATLRNHEGWFAEMRIPFSSLGFQDEDGHVEMGLGAYRLISARNERHIFPDIPPNWGFLSFAKPSRIQRVTLDGVRSRSPVYLTPYVLGGFNREAELDTLTQSYGFGHDATREVGIDIKYGITDNLTIDLTANTDFAQVEVDDQQVNLTRFSLFFPEKRQFFQERAAIFDFTTGGFSRLFHSRRIGLRDARPVPIIGGARLIGRIGSTDIGVLNMQTARSDSLASENYGVVRLKKRILNAYSTVGSMVATRVGEGGNYNAALGVDGVIRALGDEYLTVKWVSTFDTDDPGEARVLDRSRVLFRWERRRQNGIGYAFDYIRSGGDYEPDIGFQMRRDFTFFNGNLQHLWLLGETSPFHSISIGSNALTYVRNGDNTVETGLVEPALEFEFKNNARLELTGQHSHESVRDAFSLSDGTEVPAGDYSFHGGKVRFQASRANTFRPTFTVSAGSFYDGWNAALQAEPAWNLSSHFEFSAVYQLNLIRFPDRNQTLNAHLARLRADIAMDTHLSLSAFLQYNNTENVASVNARLRYHFREGNDLWVVYDEGMNTVRDGIIGARSPLSQNRALLVKYTHTLVK